MCSIKGCNNPSKGRGWCSKHLTRWTRYGSPTAPYRRRLNGTGTLAHGYWIHSVNNRLRREHVLLAEKALGRPLPKGAVVHHLNYDRSDNTPSNLVICPSTKYHRLLHMRTDAWTATGNADARTCAYCKKYDDIRNMHLRPNGCWEHIRCRNSYSLARYYIRKRMSA